MKTCLVIDDDPVVRRVLGEWLGRRGLRVLEAETVGSGIERLADGPDVVLLDLHLPNGHGRDVIRAIVERRDDIPVVVLTGYLDDHAADFPVVSVLGKPIDFRELGRALEGALEASAAIGRIRTETRQLKDLLKQSDCV